MHLEGWHCHCMTLMHSSPVQLLRNYVRRQEIIPSWKEKKKKAFRKTKVTVLCWRWYFLESICQTCLTSSIVIWTMTCKRFYWNWKPHQITEFVKSSFKRFETTKAVPMPTIKIFINYSSNDNNKQLCQSENIIAKDFPDYFFLKNILNRDDKRRKQIWWCLCKAARQWRWTQIVNVIKGAIDSWTGLSYFTSCVFCKSDITKSIT